MLPCYPGFWASATKMAMWQPSVLETYGNQTTTYINKTSGPRRLKYPNSMADEELITALTKVKPCKGLCNNLPPQTNYEILLFCSTSAHWHCLCNWPTMPQGHLYYNAYEKDIAIVNLFFGEPTVFGVFNIKSQNWLNWKLFIFRIWAVTKNDLVGLHFWLWRDLRTLPWNQFCVSGWDSLLVLH